MYLPKVPAYETFYYDLAWSDPAKAIVEIEKLLQSPANLSPEEVAGLKFLHCCLTQVRFEPRCACARLPQPHCYYDHLFEWFCIVAERRLQRFFVQYNTKYPTHHPINFNFFPPDMSHQKKVDCILFLLYLSVRYTDTVLSSMFITLQPYLILMSRTTSEFNIDQVFHAHNHQLGYLRHSTQPTYVRLITDCQNSVIGTIVYTGTFDCCDSKIICRQENCQKNHDLSYYDLRGCYFERVKMDDYKLYNTNCSNTAWVHCSMANMDFGDNCQFHNAYIAPPHLPLLIYCHTYGQQLAQIPPTPAMIKPTMHSCFLPPQQLTRNAKSFWWNKFSRLFN